MNTKLKGEEELMGILKEEVEVGVSDPSIKLSWNASTATN
jgi:hypothetical protein